MRHSVQPVRPCTLKPILKSTLRCCTTTLPPKTISKKFHNMSIHVPEDIPDGLCSTSSSSPGYIVPMSAPVSLGKRWKDYQGIKDWEGLLDPLDENLRSEIIRYGHFVEAAYRSCEFDPSSPSYATCRYPKRKLLPAAGFPETGYRVTKNLVATSGVQLPRWIEKAPTWMATQSSWIGYVAVCEDKRVISKLGRRDVVIALRGTATSLEWLENLRATLTPLPSTHKHDQDHENGHDQVHHDINMSRNDGFAPMVESGFLSLYTSKGDKTLSLQDLVRQEISRILEIYGNEPLSFTITGHSLGAALATLAAYDIKKTFQNSPLVTVISFGGPRVGNHSFRSHLEEPGTKVLRIVNSDDLITKIPGFVIDNNDSCENGGYMGSLSSWIQKLVEDSQWVYADVGRELRLSSKDLPYKGGMNIASCHELKTYLHLVNGFVSSNCPLKATAKRMLNKT